MPFLRHYRLYGPCANFASSRAAVIVFPVVRWILFASSTNRAERHPILQRDRLGKASGVISDETEVLCFVLGCD
jgi:hypothetical protein